VIPTSHLARPQAGLPCRTLAWKTKTYSVFLTESPPNTRHGERNMDLPRFRGHQGYGALRWGAEEMSVPTSRVLTHRVMGSSTDELGDTEIAAPLVRVAPGASMELAW
jgi:hypothetical protein